jgi:hypothetical protein
MAVFNCSECGYSQAVDDKYLGKSGLCPKCKAQSIVESAPLITNSQYEEYLAASIDSQEVQVAKADIAAESVEDEQLSPNEKYLRQLRARSSYEAARMLHFVVMIVCYVFAAVCVYAGFNLIWSREGGGAQGEGWIVLGAALAVGITIEQALFNAVLDMADVAIDTSRRADEQHGTPR